MYYNIYIYISRPPLSLARTLLRTARRVSQGILRGKKKKTITRAFFNTHEECAAAGEYYNIEFRHFTHTRVFVSYLRREREREREKKNSRWIYARVRELFAQARPRDFLSLHICKLSAPIRVCICSICVTSHAWVFRRSRARAK